MDDHIEIYANRNNLEDSLEWKKCGTIQGSLGKNNAQSLKLPEKFNELYVIFYWEEYYYSSAIITKFALNSGVWRDGYGNRGRYQFYEFIYNESENTITLGTCYDTDILIDGKLDVYYR